MKSFDAAPLDGKHRVHWSYVLTATVQNLYRWILVSIVSFAGIFRAVPQSEVINGVSLRNLILVILILVILILVVGISVLQYFRLKWEITDKEIRLMKGILKKTDVRIPFERIHSVNVKANLIEQAFSVVSFSLNTAGGQGQDDLTIPSLKKVFSDDIKNRIRIKKESLENLQAPLYPEGANPGYPDGMPNQAYAPGENPTYAPGMAPPYQGDPNPAHMAGAPNQAYAPGVNPAYAPGMAPPYQGDPNPAHMTGAPNQAYATGANSTYATGANPTYAPGMAPPPRMAQQGYGQAMDFRPLNQAGQEHYSKSFRIRPVELFLHGLSNGKTILYLLLAISFLSQLRDIPFIENLITNTMDFALERFVTLSIILVLTIVLAILVIAWTVSVVASILKYFEFTVQRRGDRIESERGLLTHKTTGCAVARIQELHIKRSLLRRILGYAEIRVKMAEVQAGNAEAGEGSGVIIHPFIKRKEIDGFLNEILPEFASAPPVEIGLPRVSLRRTYFRYFRNSIFFLAILLTAAWFALLELAPAFPRTAVLISVAAVIILFLCVTAYRSWKIRGMAMDDDFLVMRRGAYGIKMVVIPRKKIQIAYMCQNPFQKKVCVAHVDASSAAMGGIRERIRDVDEAQAFAYLEWIRPRTESSARLHEA